MEIEITYTKGEEKKARLITECIHEILSETRTKYTSAPPLGNVHINTRQAKQDGQTKPDTLHCLLN